MGGCACYCGLATRRNRVCWGLAAVFGLLTIVFAVCQHFEGIKCRAGMIESLNDLNDRMQSDDASYEDGVHSLLA